MSCLSQRRPLRVLMIDGKERPQYYRELRRALRADWADEIGSGDWNQPGRAQFDIALISDEFANQHSTKLCELKRRDVPTLHVVDGIVEWRNTWENPRSQKQEWGMPLFQPILADKIACLGRAQARIFESWGSVGKCEIVGAPRFDKLLDRRPRTRARSEPWTVLVMTAKTPGFTPPQTERVRQSLADLKAWFDACPESDGVAVRPRWRLTGGLDQAIGVPNDLRDTNGEELASVLEHVDAVVTTASTGMLEAMLQGVPVALLDYDNCPHYVPAAWTITASNQIPGVMRELRSPPEPKLLYQETVLHDNLACCASATPRLVWLVREMARIGRECRARDMSLRFPPRILEDPQAVDALPEQRFDLQKLYPDHPVFGNMDRVRLQAELGHLQARVRDLESYCKELEDRLRIIRQAGRALTWPLRRTAKVVSHLRP